MQALAESVVLHLLNNIFFFQFSHIWVIVIRKSFQKVAANLKTEPDRII